MKIVRRVVMEERIGEVREMRMRKELLKVVLERVVVKMSM